MKAIFAVLILANQAFGFGAISYSTTTTRWGISWNQPTLGNAEYVARANCGAYDCRTAVWVQTGCAALSTGFSRPWIYGYAYATNRWTAERLAIVNCSRADVGCRTISSICSW